VHVTLGDDAVQWQGRLADDGTDFYDLFGPTRVSRKGEAASVSYHQYLTYEKPRTLEYTLSTAYYGGLDTLPDYQNIAAPFKGYETLSGRLDSHDVRKTLGGIDDEYGTERSGVTRM